MDKCIRDAQPQVGEEILAYEEDVAVLTDTIVELQDAAIRWFNAIRRYGMKINTARGKTEFMAIKQEGQEYDLFVGDRKIYQTET